MTRSNSSDSRSSWQACPTVRPSQSVVAYCIAARSPSSANRSGRAMAASRSSSSRRATTLKSSAVPAASHGPAPGSLQWKAISVWRPSTDAPSRKGRSSWRSTPARLQPPPRCCLPALRRAAGLGSPRAQQLSSIGRSLRFEPQRLGHPGNQSRQRGHGRRRREDLRHVQLGSDHEPGGEEGAHRRRARCRRRLVPRAPRGDPYPGFHGGGRLDRPQRRMAGVVLAGLRND